jgi:hypothetical protein
MQTQCSHSLKRHTWSAHIGRFLKIDFNRAPSWDPGECVSPALARCSTIFSPACCSRALSNGATLVRVPEPLPRIETIGSGPRLRPPGPPPDVEPYPDEMVKLRSAGEKLQRKFRGTVFNEDTMNDFMHMAADVFAEVGFRVGVDWYQGRHPISGESVTVPQVMIAGRISAEIETDHDRVKHGIVNATAGGQAGYIRPDGTKREDPAKKLIV